MAVQTWFVPYRVLMPDAPVEFEDDFVALTRDDDSTPKTWGEFFVGRVEKLLHPEVWVAWWRLINEQHKKWREGA